MASKGKIIVSGIAFWYPLGGVAWQFLHYLIGLQRLGYDVYYVEDSARDVYDPGTNDFTSDPTENIKPVALFLDSFGFKDKWCFRSHSQNRTFGLDESQLRQLYQDAEIFLNVTGAQEISDEHMHIPQRIYVETDPVLSQIKSAEGDRKTFDHLNAHDWHFTFGENIGRRDSLVPTDVTRWLPTRQPVVLDLWSEMVGPWRTYTTVATWTNRGRDFAYNGETYFWSKDIEFKKFIELPQKADVSFELASEPDPQSRARFTEHGWRFVPSIPLSRDFRRYRRYIQSSRAEFTVAKDQNIRFQSGWFSDRSACYLAAGRPVITQDTGFARNLPTGVGLYSFRTMEDILAAIDGIESNYELAIDTAYEIAQEYFDAEKVLKSLLARAGL